MIFSVKVVGNLHQVSLFGFSTFQNKDFKFILTWLLKTSDALCLKLIWTDLSQELQVYSCCISAEVFEESEYQNVPDSKFA